MDCFDWVFEKLKRTQVQNFSLQECEAIFEGKLPLDLTQWYFVVVGRKFNKEHIAFFKILKYPSTLCGEHHIQLFGHYGGNCITGSIHIVVPSLSCFRQRVLNFEDQLAFERSMFLIVQNKQLLIRLKNIRYFIFKNSNLLTKKRTQLCLRTKTQLVKNIEQSLKSYTRDLHTIKTPEEIKEKLKEDILAFLSSSNSPILSIHNQKETMLSNNI